MTKVRRSMVSTGTLAMVAALGVGCRGEGVAESTRGGAGVEVTTQALTTVDIDRVLGFEATTVSDWAIIQSGPGTLSVSTTASQGSRSLAVASHGYVPVQSVALTSLGSRVGSVIHYDITLPSQLKQISPTNYGATQLYLNSTSLGLNNTYLGQVELTPLPLGQWNTVTFTPTSSVLTKLRGTYTDLRVTIVVNAPYNATQPYLLDNLRFSDSTLALVTVVDGGGHPLSGLTVTAYNGSTPTSNTGVTDSTGLAKVWVPPGSYRFGVTEAGVTTYSSATNQCQVPGICVAATIVAKCHGVVCTAKDQCHGVGVCDPSGGVCSNPNKADGTACNDGNACTKNDACTAGVCGGTAYTCNDGLACTADSCNGDGSCTFSVTAGNCLVGGACYAGGAGNPTNQCQQCTPATSQTGWSAKTNGTACNDGNACTKSDVCTAGTCGGTAYACDDGLACTADSCNGDGTCTFTLLSGNCLIGGACYASGAGSPTNQCQQCSPATSQTAWSAKTNGTACNDGNACTSNDQCTAGTCGGTTYGCDDGLACTTDTCNGDGTCSHAVVAGNCLVGGVCYGAGAASPTNQCQQCAPGSSQTGWSPKPNGTACDDGNACTQTDSCQGGACAGANPIQCTASDQCHAVGACAAGTGLCTNPAKPDGSACDDGDFLTTNDMCLSGQCIGTVTHGQQQLSGQTLPGQLGAPLVGPVPGTTPITLVVNLQLQNPNSEQELQDFAQQVSDPDSPMYRHFLEVEDFAARFGALPSDYQHVQDWATSHGLAVQTFANNLAVEVSGTAQAIQQVLYVHLDYYSRPDGTQFYGPDRQPSLDPPAGQPLPILYLENLDNMAVPRTGNNFLSTLGTRGSAYPNPFKGNPNASLPQPTLFAGDDFRRAYAYDSTTGSVTSLTGAGQCVGLAHWNGYSLADVQQYWTNTGRTYNMPKITAVDDGTLPACRIDDPPSVRCNTTDVCGTGTCKDSSGVDYCKQLNLPPFEAVCGVDYQAGMNPATDLQHCYVACPTGSGCGSSSPPNPIYGGNAGVNTGSACPATVGGNEIEMDIEMVLAMAPGADIVTFSGNGASATSPLHRMASTRPRCYQLSTSYTILYGYDALQNASVDHVLAEIASQGQAFFHFSGDSGTLVPDRVTSPWVTQVGETLLWTNRSGRYSFELPHPLSGGYIMDLTATNAYCGGSFDPVAMPWYQLGLPAPASQTYRNVPDVSMVGYQIQVATAYLSDGGFIQGTSLSTPLWAAYWALANQQSLLNGLGPIGPANPVLYAIGQTRGTGTTADVYKNCFNDIARDPNDTDDGVDTVTATGPVDNCSQTDSNIPAFTAALGYDLATGWGSPQYGLIKQLASSSPAPNRGVAVGGFGWSCAIRSSNGVSCWGDNSFSEPGNSTASNPQLTPVPVNGLPARVKINSIAAGFAHACVMLGDGTVWCWGWNNDGQLGNGTTATAPAAVAIPKFKNALAVAAGASHTCALMSDQTVWCAGSDAYGQLGNSSGSSSSTPVQVGGLSGVTAIAAGWDSNCAIVGSDSHVVCWGVKVGPNNGDPTTDPNQPTPTPVTDSAGNNLSGVAAIAVGASDFDVCAIMAADRSVKCWGSDAFGQIGDGTPGVPSAMQPYPTTVISSCGATTPLTGVKQVVVGATYACGLLAGGTVECWGYNGEGSLGDGTDVDRPCPAPVVDISGVTALSANTSAFTCALAPDGISCWGDGIFGNGGSWGVSEVPVTVHFF